MDLWPSYQKMAVGYYNTNRLLLNTGDRHDTSLNMVRDRALELPPSMAVSLAYDGGKRRYIIARDITHDLLVSVYDVNLKRIFVARFTRIPKPGDWEVIIKRIKGWKNSNLEIRAIGFQIGSAELLGILNSLRERIGGKFMEIDLFGGDIRHIALDLKTGVSYNLLLLNRIYRPGELACQIKKEEYDLKRSDLVIK